MTKLPTNRQYNGVSPYKTKPKGAGTKKGKYRSIYESKIAEQNPFLLYEPKKYRIPVLSVSGELIPTIVCGEDGDNAIVPREWFTVKNRLHTPDWLIPSELSSTGNPIIVESKGLLSLKDVRLIRCFLATFPDVDYRMLFQSNGKVAGFKSMPRVLDWAGSLGIPAFVGTKIPKEWLRNDD